LSSGCAAHLPDIRHVESIVAERSGENVVLARHHSSAAAEERVKKLLGEPISMDKAAELALLSSPKLLGDLEVLALARSELVGAILPPNPEIELEIKLPRSDTSRIEFSAHQDLGALIRLPIRVAQAATSLQAARAEAAGAVLSVAFQARSAWIELAAAEAVLTMHELVRKGTGAGYELSRKMAELGNISSLELANKRLLHEDAGLARDRAELAAATARASLRVAIGMKPNDAEISLGGALPQPPLEQPELASLRKAALRSSLDLEVLDRSYQAAAHGAHGVVAESLLDLHIGFKSEREDGEWDTVPTFEMAVPLFDHGEAALGAARAQMRRLRYQAADLSSRIDAAVRSTVAELTTHSAHAARYRELLLPLHDQVVAETLTRYNGMLVGVFELLQAKRMQTDANRRYLETVRDYWLVRARLDCILAGHLPTQSGASRSESGSSGPAQSTGGH
jgi:outer membrane protein TolC